MANVAGGRLKADRVAKLVADAKARTAPAKPNVAPPEAPTPAALTPAPTPAALPPAAPPRFDPADVKVGRAGAFLGAWTDADGVGHTVRMQHGRHTADPADPDAASDLVSRWASTSDADGSVTGAGEWTDDYADDADAARDAAADAGAAFAAADHAGPAAAPAEVDSPPPAKRDVTLGAAPLPKSKAASAVAPAVDAAHAARVVAGVFGGADPAAAMVAATGMPDDATVTVTHAGRFKPLYLDDLPLDAVGVRVSVAHPHLAKCSRFLGVDAAGKRFVKNEIIEVKKEFQGNGLGASIFAKQVESASQEGVAYLLTHAAGRKGHAMNGYITWPKLGYDMSLTDEKGIAPEDADSYAAARAAFPAAKTVLDILGTKGGKEWWTENGRDMGNARFDLDPGSRSMAVLRAYAAAKAAAKSPAA